MGLKIFKGTPKQNATADSTTATGSNFVKIMGNCKTVGANPSTSYAVV